MRLLVLSTLAIFSVTMFADDAYGFGGRKRNRGCGGCGGGGGGCDGGMVVVSHGMSHGGCAGCGATAMTGCETYGGVAYGSVGTGYAAAQPMPGVGTTTTEQSGVVQAGATLVSPSTSVMPAMNVVPGTSYYPGTYTGTMSGYSTGPVYYSTSPGYYNTGGRGVMGGGGLFGGRRGR